MNTKTLTEIDFFRIRDEIVAYCVSVEGKNNLLKREPLTKTDKIEFLKNCSREWTKYLSVSKDNPLSSWDPIHHLNYKNKWSSSKSGAGSFFRCIYYFCK